MKNTAPYRNASVRRINPPLLLSASHDSSSRAGMLHGQKAGRKTIFLTLLSLREVVFAVNCQSKTSLPCSLACEPFRALHLLPPSASLPRYPPLLTARVSLSIKGKLCQFDTRGPNSRTEADWVRKDVPLGLLPGLLCLEGNVFFPPCLGIRSRGFQLSFLWIRFRKSFVFLIFKNNCQLCKTV